MLKLPNSIEPAVMAENIVHLRDAEASLDGRVSDLEVTAPKDYSTTETATGQKWIDGKDIYEITFSGVVSGETDVSYDIPFDSLISIFGITINANTGNIYEFNKYISAFGKADKSGFLIAHTSAYAGNPYIVTFQYTKSDPTPGRAPEDSDQEPEPEEKKTTRKKGRA